MPTLHWFSSLGIVASNANYVLTDTLAKRLAPVFPQALRHAVSQPVPKRPIVAVATNVTGGLLQLLGPIADGWTVRIHLVGTPETSTATKETSAATEKLTEELKRAEADGCRWEWAQTYDCGSRDPAGLAKVLRHMLDIRPQIQPGDAVFVETTSGLRPILQVLQLGFSIMESTVEDYAFACASYGELATWSERAEANVLHGEPLATFKNQRRLSPIYDLTEILELPAWATAASDIATRLDVRRMRALTRAQAGRLEEQEATLDRLQEAYELVLTDRLVPALRAIQDDIEEVPDKGGSDSSVAVRNLLRRVLGENLRPLTTHLPDDVAQPTMRGVRFQLAIATALRDGHRYGDCLRMLREVMVSRMQVAMTTPEGAPVSRHEAERQIHKRGKDHPVKVLWEEVRVPRNATAHAGLGPSARQVDPMKVVEALRPGTAEEPDLLAQVRETCLESPDAWAIAKGPTSVPTILWLEPAHPTGTGMDSESLHERWAKDVSKDLEIVGDLDRCPDVDPCRPTKPTATLKAPGKNWGQDKAETLLAKHPGTEAVIFMNPQAAWGHRMQLVASLLERSVLSYAWRPRVKGGPQEQLVPLFTTAERTWNKNRRR